MEKSRKKRTAIKQGHYKGKLTEEQADEGIRAAKKNARRLAADARLLLDGGRYESARVMAILSIEESGKINILHGIAHAPAAALPTLWRHYRSHTRKNAIWPLVFDALSGAPTTKDDIAKVLHPDSEFPQLLEDVKQASLYSDCFGKCDWWIPNRGDDLQLTHWLVRAAERLAEGPPLTTKLYNEAKVALGL